MRFIVVVLVCLAGCEHVEYRTESKPLTLFELETKIQQIQARVEGFELQIKNNDHNGDTYRYLRDEKSNLVYYTRQLELQKNFEEDKDE